MQAARVPPIAVRMRSILCEVGYNSFEASVLDKLLRQNADTKSQTDQGQDDLMIQAKAFVLQDLQLQRGTH
jgi:hypothetical protein